MRTVALLIAGMTLLHAISVRAHTWRVDPFGSGDFVSIQDAVDAATDGDEIIVSPGIYHESIDLLGKAIEVRGEAGAGRTLVDAGGEGSAIRVRFTPGGAPRIAGLTLTGGNGTVLRDRDGRFGGGILVELASPLVEECVIKANEANNGGGVFVVSGSPRFVRCSVIANSAGTGGGGAVELDGGAVFEQCEILDNAAVFGGGVDLYRSRARFDRCRFRGNRALEGGGARIQGRGDAASVFRQGLFDGNSAEAGGALLVRDGAFILTESTLALNESGPAGGSLEIDSGIGRVERTIVAGDRVGAALKCGSFEGETTCTLYHGRVSQNDLCGDLDRVLIADPLFCDPDRGDFSLRSDSPALPGQGPEGCGRIGLLGVGCEAPTPNSFRRWGEIRALFR